MHRLLFLLSLLAFAGCSSDGNAPDSGPAVDSKTGPPDEPFGRICDNLGGSCPETVNGQRLYCLAVQGSAAGKGFCSLACAKSIGGGQCFGVPNGLWSECLLAGPQNDAGPYADYCVFLCAQGGRNYECPPTLRCGTKDGSGRAYCIP